MRAQFALSAMTGTDFRELTFSPSDLTAYLECHHLARLELEVKRGERVRPVVENLQAELIRRKGEEHEGAYVARLRADGILPRQRLPRVLPPRARPVCRVRRRSASHRAVSRPALPDLRLPRALHEVVGRARSPVARRAYAPRPGRAPRRRRH